MANQIKFKIYMWLFDFDSMDKRRRWNDMFGGVVVGGVVVGGVVGGVVVGGVVVGNMVVGGTSKLVSQNEGG